MDKSKLFGKFLEEKRKELQLTMRQFAEQIEITAPYLSDIEKGRRAAPNDKLKDIARVLRLNSAEQAQMYDYAAFTRDNQTSADISEYVMNNDLARVALRQAKISNITDEQWKKIINLIERKGN